MSETEPKSPCISVCLLDDKDICTGCYRSAVEITEWRMATAAAKRGIIANARQRLLASTTIRLS